MLTLLCLHVLRVLHIVRSYFLLFITVAVVSTCTWTLCAVACFLSVLSCRFVCHQKCIAVRSLLGFLHHTIDAIISLFSYASCHFFLLTRCGTFVLHCVNVLSVDSD